MAQIKHYHHHYHFSYTTTLKRHFSSFGVILVILTILLILGSNFISAKPVSLSQLSIVDLFTATTSTLIRLTTAYLICLALSVPLALLITANSKTEKFLLPIVDIIQSIPILAFFPLIVLVFIKINFLEAAAIFVLFISMLWSLTFSMIGGLKTVPEDIKNAAIVFNARGMKKLFNITLPAVLPYIVTGSLLSWGAGWNVLIIAEALHTYIPGGSSNQDLYGLGSLLVNATLSGQSSIFISALLVMVILIGLMNFFIWQKLLHFAERFKFD